jgi:hypothetical protein
MPYIPQADRQEIDDKFSYTSNDIHSAGELNYAITLLINYYISQKGKGYSSINEVVGVLECAKLELYRRIAAPYEDSKIQQNGDVYSI